MEEQLHLFIYGEVGGGGFFEEETLSVEAISKQLTNNPEAKEVIVHISSPGGSVFDGWTIGNLIKNSGKKTTALIEGLCASIATFIALSCDRVEMAETARFMIHNPTALTEGEEDDLKGEAEQLGKIKDDLIRTYKEQTKLPISQLSKMMDEETILTAQEAKDLGFIDDFMTPLKAVAYYKTYNKMTEKKEDPKVTEAKVSKMDQIIQQGKEILKSLLVKNSEHNVIVTLADGTPIFIESEDGEFEGKAAFTVDEAGNPTQIPVEDGTFAMEDGRSITVEGGIVVSVQESAPEEVDLLKAKIEELEQGMKDSEKEKEVSEKESEETKKSVTDLIAEVKNLKTLTVGDKTPLKIPIIHPQNKFRNNEPDDGHPLNQYARDMKALRNKTI